MHYIQLLFQSIGIALVCYLFISYRRKASQTVNEFAIADWIRNLDVIAHGQRWQGSRSEPIYAMRADRVSFANYTYEVLCVTRSGRWYILTVDASLSLVTRWEITPVSKIDVTHLLELEEQEIDELINGLHWECDRSSASDSAAQASTQRAPRSAYKRGEARQYAAHNASPAAD